MGFDIKNTKFWKPLGFQFLCLLLDIYSRKLYKLGQQKIFMSELKLTIELVPSTAWGVSIYQICTHNKKLKIWKDFKESLFFKEGRKCFICGTDNIKLEAHEFWSYDEVNHIQKLIAIHHLCHLCHKIKHSGLWFETDYGLENLKKQNLTTEDLINHFCKVNNCKKEDFYKHKEEAFKIFNERSNYNWTQDFGEYNYLLKS